jgi:hypothetical protein
MVARRLVAILSASLTLVGSSPAGARASEPRKSVVAACADTSDVYLLHMSVGSVLDVDEYVDTIRAAVSPKDKRLRRAFAEYDHARSRLDYERSLRRLLAWCTRRYGPL